jgi:hypothetical protein
MLEYFVYIILLQYLFEVILCKVTYNVKMFCGKWTSSPHYQLKINVNALFSHLILMSQKAFHQQLLVSANFMVLEEILWCMHCSTHCQKYFRNSPLWRWCLPLNILSVLFTVFLFCVQPVVLSTSIILQVKWLLS